MLLDFLAWEGTGQEKFPNNRSREVEFRNKENMVVKAGDGTSKVAHQGKLAKWSGVGKLIAAESGT